MSAYNIYMRAPEYLRHWLKHEYWSEERQRVEFPRGSAAHAILTTLMRKTPQGHIELPGEDTIAVEVPTIKGLNPQAWNYLGDSGRHALLQACKKLFQAQLYTELHELFLHDVQITDIIYDYMERHGIEATEKNWETIRQMYMRMRKKSGLLKS